MLEHRTVSVSRVYVPNEYVVYLSPQDRERYAEVEDEVIDELGAYLLEHARREQVSLASRPIISFATDEELSLGEFGIQARLVRAAHEDDGDPEQGEHGHTMIYSTSERHRAPADHQSTPPARRARCWSSTAGACSCRRGAASSGAAASATSCSTTATCRAATPS